MRLLLPLLATVAVLGDCSAIPHSHAVHEKRDSHSTRWTNIGRAPANKVLPMRIGLAQSNLDDAHNYLTEISHPASPNYGKHWTSEQVINAFKPSDETVETVRNWLADAGIRGVVQSENKAWLAFHATVKQAEALLHTEYNEYEDRHTGGIMPACEQYHVPKYIQKHIDYITPGIKLLAPGDEGPNTAKTSLRKRESSNGASSCF